MDIKYAQNAMCHDLAAYEHVLFFRYEFILLYEVVEQNIHTNINMTHLYLTESKTAIVYEDGPVLAHIIFPTHLLAHSAFVHLPCFHPFYEQKPQIKINT